MASGDNAPETPASFLVATRQSVRLPQNNEERWMSAGEWRGREKKQFHFPSVLCTRKFVKLITTILYTV